MIPFILVSSLKRGSANQRVETYSVYGGNDETSLARPKSASFMTSLLTNRFSVYE